MQCLACSAACLACPVCVSPDSVIALASSWPSLRKLAALAAAWKYILHRAVSVLYLMLVALLLVRYGPVLL